MRPYTGTREGVGRGKRAGTELLAARLQRDTAGRVWNNGTYQMRPMRGSSLISVHATGRALDLSYRKTGKHQGADRAFVVRLMDAMTENADALGLEMIIDYAYPGGLKGGRVWKCDRNAWQDTKPGVISGGGKPGSDWFHVELSPTAADSPENISTALDQVLRTMQLEDHTTPAAAPQPKYPGRPLKLGSQGVAVKAIQMALDIVIDGKFGPQTENAVKAFQRTRAATENAVDGVVGPITWGELFRPTE